MWKPTQQEIEQYKAEHPGCCYCNGSTEHESKDCPKLAARLKAQGEMASIGNGLYVRTARKKGAR